MAKILHAAFKNVKFKDSKLMGLHFESCNQFLFAVRFTGCKLNLSSFYKLSLKNTRFINCQLHEVDFTESNLSNAIFSNCDLYGAIFENSNLENADFRSAIHYSIDPEMNKIKKAKFSMDGIQGLLNKYEIEID